MDNFLRRTIFTLIIISATHIGHAQLDGKWIVRDSYLENFDELFVQEEILLLKNNDHNPHKSDITILNFQDSSLIAETYFSMNSRSKSSFMSGSRASRYGMREVVFYAKKTFCNVG